MTTEKTRNINELLSLTTYQGMTDEEIELVIAYKVRNEVHKKMIENVDLVSNMKTEQLLANNKANCELARNMLESVYGRELVLKVVSNE